MIVQPQLYNGSTRYKTLSLKFPQIVIGGFIPELIGIKYCTVQDKLTYWVPWKDEDGWFHQGKWFEVPNEVETDL